MLTSASCSRNILRIIKGNFPLSSPHYFPDEMEVKTCDFHPRDEDVEPLMSETKTIDLINGIRQGVASYQRIGNRISMESVKLNLQLVCQSRTSDSDWIPGMVRIVVFYATRAVYTTMSDAFAAQTENGTVTSTISFIMIVRKLWY